MSEGESKVSKVIARLLVTKFRGKYFSYSHSKVTLCCNLDVFDLDHCAPGKLLCPRFEMNIDEKKCCILKMDERETEKVRWRDVKWWKIWVNRQKNKDVEGAKKTWTERQLRNRKIQWRHWRTEREKDKSFWEAKTDRKWYSVRWKIQRKHEHAKKETEAAKEAWRDR